MISKSDPQVMDSASDPRRAAEPRCPICGCQTFIDVRGRIAERCKDCRALARVRFTWLLLAEVFARRLFELGRIVLISVPYKWRKGSNQHRVNDPVDLDSLVRWFGRTPNYRLVVREPFHGRKGEHLFAIFDVADPARKFGSDVRKSRRPA